MGITQKNTDQKSLFSRMLSYETFHVHIKIMNALLEYTNNYFYIALHTCTCELLNARFLSGKKSITIMTNIMLT